jgi:hypothetical protein
MPETRIFGGRIPNLCVVVVILFLAWEFGRGLIFGPPNYNAVGMALLVSTGAFVGAYYAFDRVEKLDIWFSSLFPIFGQHMRDSIDAFEVKRGQFLSFSYVCIALYLIAYLVALERLSLARSNAGWLVIGVTAVTLGAQMFFCVRYAAYVRLIAALKCVVDDKSRYFMVDDMLDRDRELGFKRLEQLRDAAFRDEQLYEPPGNIFVTVGITATFLGLAVGLATLDLTAITQGGGNVAMVREGANVIANVVGDNVTAAPVEGAKDLSSLISFIGCMGLALGVSMLGVLMAMAAQWLRGYGPAESTDAILARATKILSDAGR